MVGETASGKSALAMELARRFNGEIICADSWTVRREVNIGTAKPSSAEQAEIPHHLLDVAGPDEDFTAAVFKRLALAAIDDITKRGKLPIMVGGTGLYIDGVIYDYGFLEAGDRIERERYNVLSIDELLAEIEAEGIELGDVDRRNKRRLIRLLETNGALPSRGELRANTLMLGLATDRTQLHARIETRVDNMLSAGLEAETKAIAEHYGWDCEALKGVGYSQWKDYFLGSQTLADTRDKIIKATKDLAKRQRTWFKRNDSTQWLPTPVNLQQVSDIVTTFLSIN
ncbi:MAG: tRNA dimethylallyltransferase [Candidatus Saccharibacteria bacterium]|nr:tRNA dimethylallyltransferase [Candidatus Saccharibacteria bacterium]